MIVVYALVRFMPSTRDLALASVVLVAISGIVAYATGGGAEKILENLGVAEATMEKHEASAMLALVSSLVGAGVAILTWVARRNVRLEKRLFVGLLVVMLAVDGAYARTGFLGGTIRHTEVLGVPAAATLPTVGTETTKREVHESH
jgi:hypothetical protein